MERVLEPTAVASLLSVVVALRTKLSALNISNVRLARNSAFATRADWRFSFHETHLQTLYRFYKLLQHFFR